MKTKLASGSYRLVVLLSVTMSLSFGMSAARGDLFFSDSFRYHAGSLDGQGPPLGAPAGQTGWTTVTGNPQTVTTGLVFPRLLAAGGSTSFSGTNFDFATANLSPLNSGVVWVGFLFQLDSGTDSGYAVLNVGGLSSSQPGFGVIFGTGLLGIDNGTGTTGEALTSIAPSAMTQWLVVKLDFTAGTEALFVNPVANPKTPDARVRMSPDFQAAGFNKLFLDVGNNSGVWQYDEIRVGTTFTDIARGH